jgi:hypothetical protein
MRQQFFNLRNKKNRLNYFPVNLTVSKTLSIPLLFLMRHDAVFLLLLTQLVQLLPAADCAGREQC